ncbi:MAG: (2Fe-2S)-binding protein [Planctomyces sp.]|nr:(2Fe-2S)-binding protein [Planctomyces sp.]
MSAGYKAVQWNAHKRAYDAAAVSAVVVFVGVYVGVSAAALGPDSPGPEVLALRGLGLCGLTLLHAALCIGPMARLWPGLSPLLYNRRHLGVMIATIGASHAAIAVGYYGGFGVRNPVLAVVDSAPTFGSVSRFPFETLGMLALVILGVMAATSHDFWLRRLGPRAWKSIHMFVYLAYALLVGHVAWGVMQSEPGPVAPALLGLGVLTVSGLHIAAGLKELRGARVGGGAPAQAAGDGTPWVDGGDAGTIADGRARVVALPGGDRVAVYRQGSALSALANRCAHQGGPLGEGQVIDGCVTCPWHGYQYVARNGSSPPPFTDKVATYRLSVRSGRVLIDPRALPPGTDVPPTPIAPSGGVPTAGSPRAEDPS